MQQRIGNWFIIAIKTFSEGKPCAMARKFAVSAARKNGMLRIVLIVLATGKVSARFMFIQVMCAVCCAEHFSSNR